MNQLTENEQNKLKELTAKGCTDSDIENFCEENKVSLKAALCYVSELYAPLQCRGCKNVDFYPNMSPCIYCCRIHQKDYFVSEMS